jgi:hypothetical protein
VDNGRWAINPGGNGSRSRKFSSVENADDDIEQNAAQDADQEHRGQGKIKAHIAAFKTNITRQVAQPG